MTYKRRRFIFLYIVVLAFLITSCSKSEDTVTEGTITEDTITEVTVTEDNKEVNLESVINKGIESVGKVAVETLRSTQLTDLVNEESEKTDQMSKEIIRCFTEHDKEALKSLFCQQVRNQPDFDESIDRALEYFKCDLYITSKSDMSSGGEESWREGERVKWSVWPEIPYIAVLFDVDGDDATDDMVTLYYSINYDWQITDKEDPSREGLQHMNIELLNVDSIQIGN